ncbi:MAG: right-handed parallel beta-helix repeat-containing protein [Candidatus Bathyarchaeota archaeon]|nr:right-handed parallel beta-helix repeat-containing protein [Candidatus Bathyarchaeota archaeon]
MPFAAVRPVNAQGTVYIREDGTVEGTDNIVRVGCVYSFVDDIFEQEIVVEKDNIVIDGSNFTLRGGGWQGETGIYVLNRRNVTICNVKVTGYTIGIFLESTSDSSVTNSVIDNEFLAYSTGLRLVMSNYNTITENVIANNTLNGVHLFVTSSNNNITRNVITGNGIGLYLSGGEITSAQTIGNNIVENNVTNNNLGIYVDSRGINMIYHNNFINNTRQWDVIGLTPPLPLKLEVSANIWDDGEHGNYWSDYNGTDTNNDGIGDTAYLLSEDNQDNYPAMDVIPEFPSWLFIPLLFVATLTAIFFRKRLRGVSSRF